VRETENGEDKEKGGERNQAFLSEKEKGGEGRRGEDNGCLWTSQSPLTPYKDTHKIHTQMGSRSGDFLSFLSSLVAPPRLLAQRDRNRGGVKCKQFS